MFQDNKPRGTMKPKEKGKKGTGYLSRNTNNGTNKWNVWNEQNNSNMGTMERSTRVWNYYSFPGKEYKEPETREQGNKETFLFGLKKGTGNWESFETNQQTLVRGIKQSSNPKTKQNWEQGSLRSKPVSLFI
jgi:hypothetical protein